MTFSWRLVKQRRASTAFSGEGARLYPERWNRAGTAMVYTCESVALAALEVFVHLGRTDTAIEFALFQVTIPDHFIEDLDSACLPTDWRDQPATRFAFDRRMLKS